MAVSVSGQTLAFLTSCLVGVLLGILYDVFRIIRIAVPCGKKAIFFQDFLFFVFCTVVTFLFLLVENAGEIRFFMLEGEVLGAVLYFFTLGILVMKASTVLIRLVKQLIKLIAGILYPPATAACDYIAANARKQGRKAKNLLKKENKLLKINLQPKLKVLYNQIYRKKRKTKKRKLAHKMK